MVESVCREVVMQNNDKTGMCPMENKYKEEKDIQKIYEEMIKRGLALTLILIFKLLTKLLFNAPNGCICIRRHPQIASW